MVHLLNIVVVWEMSNMKTKSLFVDTRKGPYPGAVRLNSIGDPQAEFLYYAEAFHAAGQSLVQDLKNKGGFFGYGTPINSIKAVPIVYLYWHAMELYLKTIILDGRDILPLRGKPRIELRENHILEALANDVDQIFDGFGWDWDFGSPHFKTLAEFIAIVKELQKVAEVRYPTRKKDGGAVVPENFRFNLFQFCELLDSVFEALNVRAFSVGAQLQQEQETRYAEENNP